MKKTPIPIKIVRVEFDKSVTFKDGEYLEMKCICKANKVSP